MIKVNSEKCDLCGSCVAVCPSDSIEMFETHLVIDQGSCIECELCIEMCPFEALLND